VRTNSAARASVVRDCRLLCEEWRRATSWRLFDSKANRNATADLQIEASALNKADDPFRGLLLVHGIAAPAHLVEVVQEVSDTAVGVWRQRRQGFHAAQALCEIVGIERRERSLPKGRARCR